MLDTSEKEKQEGSGKCKNHSRQQRQNFSVSTSKKALLQFLVSESATDSVLNLPTFFHRTEGNGMKKHK